MTPSILMADVVTPSSLKPTPLHATKALMYSKSYYPSCKTSMYYPKRPAMPSIRASNRAMHPFRRCLRAQESPLALPAVLEPFQNSYPPRCQRSPWRYRHTARSVPEVRKNQTETSLKGSESARSSKKTQYDSRTMRYTRAVQRGKTYAHG